MAGKADGAQPCDAMVSRQLQGDKETIIQDAHRGAGHQQLDGGQVTPGLGCAADCLEIPEPVTRQVTTVSGNARPGATCSDSDFPLKCGNRT